MTLVLSEELSTLLNPIEASEADGFLFHKLLSALVALHLRRLMEIQDMKSRLESEEIDTDEYREWKMSFDVEGKELADTQRALQSLLKSPAA